MRHYDPQQIAAAYLAGVKKDIEEVGGHNWSDKIGPYMKAEAKKLKANWLYCLAQCIPFGRDLSPGKRLDMALGVLGILGGITVWFFSFLGGITSWAAGTSYTVTFISVCAASLVVLCGSVYLATTNNEIKVRGPGVWKTEPYDPALDHHFAPIEARQMVENLKTMLPEARFEISVLYQDESIFDPVLWLVLEFGGLTVRIPFVVWGPDYKIVLPH